MSTTFGLHIHIELLLCYPDEGVAGVALQNKFVVHHVIVDPLVVADMQLLRLVRLSPQVDLRWSLVQDVVRVIQCLELVDNTAPAE